ncbi:MAG: hypothetical protein WAW37_18980 [Syntrophobacteraceae bacterium]
MPMPSMETGMVTVRVEDRATGKILRDEYNRVAPATGGVPSTATQKIPGPATCDE